MAQITWDAVGEHLYSTGVDHGVLYLYDSQTKKFTNGVAWNGLTAVNESPSGAEPTPVWADNIKYLNLMSAEEYGFTIEALDAPDEFDECDGSKEIATGIKIGQQDRKLFAFCYRTLKGNDTEGTAHGYEIHIVYNCLASPSERNHSTVNDSPENETLSWSVSTTALDTGITGMKPTATVILDSNVVGSANMKKIEDILYGVTPNTVAECPLPAKILQEIQ